MENRRIIKSSTMLGGALISALLITFSPVLAYDQENTHPALTDEIVDFYNLNFPDKKLTNQEKQWLIQGAVEEDTGERPLFHFYDPVYNRGIAHFSSKDWALKPSVQANYYNSQLTGFAAIFGGDSANDFSYGRALDDYAKGDKERAFIAFGHTLHLLEDAGVPDHTRNDAHPAFIHGQESPYEHEMAKWNPNNFQIARKLFLTRKKPVALNDMADYFDKMANYSNNNFFSKDTISNKEYDRPNINRTKELFKEGKERIFIMGNDGNGHEFPLAFIDVLIVDGKNKIRDISLTKPEIGSYILDGYWDRLSKEIVLSGAGALNLFLTEAEKAKMEYANQPPEKPNWFARLFGLIGNEVKELTTSDDEAPSDVKKEGVDNSNDGDSMVTPTPKVTNPSVSPTPLVTKTPVTNVTTSSPSVSPTLSPIPSPELAEKVNINTANKESLMTLKGIKEAKSDAIIQHRQTNGPFQNIEDIMNVSGIGQATFEEIKDFITVGDIVPTPSPVFYASSGGGGGSSSSPTPTPLPSVTPTPIPSPTPDPSSPLLQVVINEIAWMGTATSSSDEWLELYNTTNQPVDLTGWTLKSITGTSPDPQITLTGTIQPFGFYLLERTSDTTISDILADKIYTGALGNGGEYLELRNTSGNLQDFVDGSSAWFNKGSASPDYKSMERINPKQQGNDTSNWSTNNGTTKNGQDAAGNPINGTPKSRNSGYVALKPSAITNLVATLNSPLAITWSAPEDLDTLPASLSYDLRYSFTNFPDANTWDTATVVASSSLPSVGEKEASQSASFDITYQYGQTLYFALKTKVIHIPTCDVGNVDKCSDISNIAAINFPTAIDANAWSMLGKDQYHTSFAANAVGPGPTATISWEFNTGTGNMVSQPVVSADGDIYFGSANGSGKLIKLNKDGTKQWEYATNVSVGTPAVLSDELVYFGRVGAGGTLAFTALNSDGSKKWDYNDASTVQAFTVSSKGEPHFTYSSGTDKLVILNTDGSIKTQVSNSGLSGFAPVVLDNGTIIAARRVSGNQFFTAYSTTGSQSWDLAYTGANGSMQSNPSYDQTTGKTYSAIGHDGGSSFGFRIFVIPSDGSVLNTTVIDPTSNGSAATMVSITPTKLLVGLDYSWFNPASGSKLFSLNKSDLTISWSFQAEGKINQQVAVDKDGNAYFSTQSGHVYVDPDGHERWHVSTSIGSVISPVLIENGIVWGYGSIVLSIK